MSDQDPRGIADYSLSSAADVLRDLFLSGEYRDVAQPAGEALD